MVTGIVAAMVVTGVELSKSESNAAQATAAIVGGVGAAWLARASSGLVADWTDGRRPTPRSVARQWAVSWQIVLGAVPATVALVVAGAGAYSTNTGLWAAQWAGIGVLALVGVVTAVRSKERAVWKVGYVVALVAVGWLMVGLQLVVKQF